MTDAGEHPGRPPLCPEPAALQKFSNGSLAHRELDRIARHVETCQSCLANLIRFDNQEDVLISILRATAATETTSATEFATGDRKTVADRATPLTTATNPSPSTAPDERYRVLRPHASGGIGDIFVAEDAELNREVAFKTLQYRHADSPCSRSRFLFEAEITGALEHRGIVPVYSLGKSIDGRPFYTMRLIRGVSLREAIKACRQGARLEQVIEGQKQDGQFVGRADISPVDLRELLKRFQDVCNVVDYAHDRGMLHLDLKPANIMLGRYGETFVVDWGQAKRLDEPEPTTGSPAGTLGYRSPEQTQGRYHLLEPPSDVYSLGATLFYILTGRSPIEQDESGGSTDLDQPRRIPSPRSLDASIPKELEAICLKAMAVNPDDRYGSAKGLAADVERFTAGDPVTAWPEPMLTRVQRWGRRHRTMVAMVAVALVASVIGLGVILTIQAQHNSNLVTKNTELKRAHALAERTAETARSRARIGVDANNAIVATVRADKELADPAFKALRDRLLRLIFRNLEQWKNELDQQRDDDPGTIRDLAAAYVSFATISGEIGSKQDALSAYEKARSLVEEVVEQKSASGMPATYQARLDVAQAWINVGEAERETGKAFESVRSLETGRSLLAELARSDAGAAELDSDQRNRVARTLMDLGRALRDAGKRADAFDSYKQALTLLESARADQLADLQNQFDRAGLLNNLGNVSFDADRAGALKYFGQAAALYSSIVARATDGNDPRRLEFRREEAICSYNLGRLHSTGGRFAEAIELFEKARSIQEELVREDPARSLLRSDLAATHFELAELLARKSNDPSAVRTSFRKALEFQTRLVNENPDYPQFRYELALTNYRLGIYDWKKGNAPGDARKHIEAAISTQEALVANHPGNIKYQLELAKTRDYLAILLDEFGEHSRAIDVEAKSIQTVGLALASVPAFDAESVRQLSIPLVRANINRAYSSLKAGAPMSALDSVSQALEVLETKYRGTPDDRFLSQAKLNINDLLKNCQTARSEQESGPMKGLTEKVQFLRSRAEKVWSTLATLAPRPGS